MRFDTRRSFGTFLAVGLVTIAVASPLAALAQACSDELPTAAKPVLKSCSWIDLLCKSRNQDAETQWRNQSRTFSDRYEIDQTDDNDPQNVEYKARGCRGTIIAPEVSPVSLSTMHVSILAPSGTEIFQEDFQNQGRPVMGRSTRLPETGTYTIRVSTTSPSKAVEVCNKYKSEGWLKSTCIDKGTKYVHPTAYTIAFRGSADATSLAAGDRADGTVTDQQPFARRINMDRQVAGQVNIKSMSGMPVAARVERDDGSLIGQESGTALVVAIPPTSREAIYLLSVSVGAGTQPAAITVSVDTGTAAAKRLAVGVETVAEFQSLPADLGVGGVSAPSTQWTFSVSRPVPARLSIIPSGLAGLVLSVAVYNKTTEEVVADSKRIDRATTLQIPVRRPGDYVVIVTPLQIAPGHSSAKYTLTVSQ